MGDIQRRKFVPADSRAVAALSATCYPTRMVMKKLVIAALIQGAAAAALDPSSAGPSAEDLERATGLIQDAAASRPDGPSSSELEAAAALIQGVAPRP